MRAHSAITSALRDRRVHCRVTIGGVVVSPLCEGLDWIQSVKVSTNVDSAVAEAELSIWRESYELSMAPLNGSSKFNATSPLLVLTALVVIEVSEAPTALAAVTDYHEIFRGRIDSIDSAATPILVSCRDMAADVLDRCGEMQLCYAIGRQTSGVFVWEAGRSVAPAVVGAPLAGFECVPSQLCSPLTSATPTFACSQAGITGTTEPTWWTVEPSIGPPVVAGTPVDSEITDGSAKWQHNPISPAAWAAGATVLFGVVRTITDGTWGPIDVVCVTEGVTGSTQPAIPVYLPPGSEINAPGPAGATFDDGSARWAVYPSADGGVSLEAIIQGILLDHFGATEIPALWTPVRCPYWRTPFIVPAQSVLESIRSLAAEIGWDLRLEYNPSSTDHTTWGKWRLCLFEPRRSNSSSDATFTADEYFPPTKCAQSLASIRNVIEVGYCDDLDRWPGGERKRKFVSAVDATSIDDFDRRFMGLGEGSSNNVSTQDEAQALADACLSDLAQPPLDWDVPVPLRWWVELGDLYTFAADWVHFSSNQKLAVVGYSHEISATKNRTTLRTRGKASAGIYRWQAMAARPGGGRPSRVIGGQRANSVVVESAAKGGVLSFQRPDVQPPKGGFGGGAGAGGGYESAEVHISDTSGFVPSSGTLKALTRGTRFDLTDLTPGTTYYAKVVMVDQLGNRSPASEEVIFEAKHVELGDITKRVFDSGCAVLSEAKTLTVTGDPAHSSDVPWDVVLWGFKTEPGTNIGRATWNTVAHGWRFNEEAHGAFSARVLIDMGVAGVADAGNGYQLEMLLNAGALLLGPMSRTMEDSNGRVTAELTVDAELHVYNEDIVSIRIVSPASTDAITVVGFSVDSGVAFQSSFQWRINQILSTP